MSLRLFAACAPGLEPLLADELAALGAAPDVVRGGVEVDADPTRLHRAHLETGLASHLLVRVQAFRAHSFAELERGATRVDWARFLSPGAPLAFRARAKKSRLYHTGAIAERVRGAVEAQLGALPEPDDGAPALLARIERDRCTLSLDTSGEPLHRRGYRLATGKAPLREDLARALVRVSGWDPETPLADPFCGSGTIAIEAAILARGLPPGRLRAFALERTPLFDATLFGRLRAEAEARALERAPAPIWASDRDPGAVEATRANAERAGVLADLRLDQTPLGKARIAADAPPRGALVTNPPHGERVGDPRTLRALHQTLGRIVPPEWRVALLVRDRRLALATGLDLHTALLTDSGGSKVRMMVR